MFHLALRSVLRELQRRREKGTKLAKDYEKKLLERLVEIVRPLCKSETKAEWLAKQSDAFALFAHAVYAYRWPTFGRVRLRDAEGEWINVPKWDESAGFRALEEAIDAPDDFEQIATTAYNEAVEMLRKGGVK